MEIRNIIDYLETIAPLEYQEDYDNSGLLVGDPDGEAKGVMLSLDLTEQVLDEAVAHGCNLVISHHPFLFKGIRKLIKGNPETALLTRAIRLQVALYAIHTNLDNTLEGINSIIMKSLGITRYHILRPQSGKHSKLVTFCPSDYVEKVRNAIFSAGAGHIGNYDYCSFNLEGTGTFRASEKANPFVGEINKVHKESETRIEVILPNHLINRAVSELLLHHPYEEVAYDVYPLSNQNSRVGSGLIGDLSPAMHDHDFLELVKTRLNVPCIRHSKLQGRKINRIALCSGSGSFLIEDAIKARAGIYLTGDLKYHDFFNAEKNIILADIGHYESEQCVKEWLFAMLNEKFPNFAVLISETERNPVHYL